MNRDALNSQMLALDIYRRLLGENSAATLECLEKACQLCLDVPQSKKYRKFIVKGIKTFYKGYERQFKLLEAFSKIGDIEYFQQFIEPENGLLCLKGVILEYLNKTETFDGYNQIFLIGGSNKAFITILRDLADQYKVLREPINFYFNKH